jgi:hypothetical protein
MRSTLKSIIIQIDDVQWKELKELSGNSLGVYEFFKEKSKEQPRMSSIVTFIENNLACHDGILFDSWNSYVDITFTSTDNVAIMHLDFDAEDLKVENLTAYRRWWKNVENTYPGILFHIIKHAQRADVEGKVKTQLRSGSDKALSAVLDDKFAALKDKSRIIKANDGNIRKKIQMLKNKKDLVNSKIPVKLLNLKRKRNQKFIRDIHGQ